MGRHPNPQKAHPWVTTRYLSHKRLKSVQGCDLGAISRKKYKYDQDRTEQDRTGQLKSQKTVIFHISGGKAIAIKFDTVVDVHELVYVGKV